MLLRKNGGTLVAGKWLNFGNVKYTLQACSPPCSSFDLPPFATCLSLYQIPLLSLSHWSSLLATLNGAREGNFVGVKGSSGESDDEPTGREHLGWNNKEPR